jgi:uncharacterized Tic20 family protein
MEPQRIEDLEKKADEFALGGIVHLSFLFGMFIFSGIMLAVCKDKSEYVRFQIAQVLATQVAWLCFLLCYVVLFMAVMMFTIFTSAATKTPPFAVFVIIPIHFIVVFGSIFLNFVLAIVGMIKGFQGKDWAIPVIGKWVFRKFFQGKRGGAGE